MPQNYLALNLKNVYLCKGCKNKAKLLKECGE